MDIIVGHGSMDLDCIGSMVLARYLYPGYRLVRSHLAHPVARNLMNMYEQSLGFLDAGDLKGQDIGHVVVVDARTPDRISEIARAVDLSKVRVDIWDHHPSDGKDIPGASVREGRYGANTTQLGLELMRSGIRVSHEDATMALTGIYADTGNFTHRAVTEEDFAVASFLLSCGADLRLVKDFLAPLRERHQLALFHEVLKALESRKVRGHLVHSCRLSLDDDSSGLGAVVEQVFEVERCELILGFFHFGRKGKTLVIGRNANPDIHLGELMAAFGGGGHAQAASATVKGQDGHSIMDKVMDYLEDALAPAPSAGDIMSRQLCSVGPDERVLDASMAMESAWHTGLPVVNPEGAVLGMITMRDVMRARKAGQMHVPVSTFMSRTLVSASPAASVRELDDLMFERDIGHLPIVDGGRIVGMVTRGDILDYKRDQKRRKNAIMAELKPEPPPAQSRLRYDEALITLPLE